MPKFGLIGYPLSHSFSKKYFNQKFQKEGLEDHYYELFPLKHITQFSQLLTDHPDLLGINVTIPYKEAVLPYLDELDQEAEAIGAVNCIHRTAGCLIGYNTDVYGFRSSLERFLRANNRQPAELQALVLGTGGAAKAVCFVLKQIEISAQLVSRKKQEGVLTYAELDEKTLRDHLLVINTTPLGMAPHTEACPDIPYDQITSEHLLYDLIYNPEKTLFLQRGLAVQAATLNGTEMLYGQAERNWQIWNNRFEK